MWPKLAEYWGLEWEGPRSTPFKLEEKMKGKSMSLDRGFIHIITIKHSFGSKDELWKKIVAKYNIKDLDVDRIATWKFADMIFGR